jgi:pimeloyl-ACP methyl ester carboxylesterase
MDDDERTTIDTSGGARPPRLITFTTAGHGVHIDERDELDAEVLGFARS